jgi:hypothetical protein
MGYLVSAEKIAVGSEGAAEGGVGGIPPRPSRSPAVAGWRASARGGGLASLVWFRSAILDKMSSSKVYNYSTKIELNGFFKARR